MSTETADDILRQIGWDREGTMFCSLNLTTEQAEVFNSATLAGGDNSTEEIITEALTLWLQGQPDVYACAVCGKQRHVDQMIRPHGNTEDLVCGEACADGWNDTTP